VSHCTWLQSSSHVSCHLPSQEPNCDSTHLKAVESEAHRSHTARQ
jgi:hypothetical protein